MFRSRNLCEQKLLQLLRISVVFITIVYDFESLKSLYSRKSLCLCWNNLISLICKKFMPFFFLFFFQLGNWNNWLKIIIFCRKIIIFSKLIYYNFIFHCNWTFLFHCVEHFSNVLLLWRHGFCSSIFSSSRSNQLVPFDQ